MPEGLSASEVGKEIGEHARRRGDSGHERRDRVLAIVEALLLSFVTLAAAWSGYSAAKWSTESSVLLAQATADRTKANQAALDAQELRNFDSSTFDAWFTAYVIGDEQAMRIAERRFRPEFKVAFDAWQATDPETNPNAAAGPTYVPEYAQPELAKAEELERAADEAFAEGAEAGETSDKYVRVTVFLASVLFLVGISTHFPYRGVRYALIGLGGVVLVVSLVLLSTLPLPPS